MPNSPFLGLWTARLKMDFATAVAASTDDTTSPNRLMAAAVGCCTCTAAAPCALARRQSSSYRAITMTDPWTDVLLLLPIVPSDARTNRVCAYDHPGTLRYTDGVPLTNDSTAVAQPIRSSSWSSERSSNAEARRSLTRPGVF